MNTYLLNNLFQNRDIVDSIGEYQLMIGNDKDFLPTRISYKLNLNGPSVNVQTACSTSLVAVHLACQSLRNSECDMALAGGVSIRLPQEAGYLYTEGMILSPDGHCRAFDAQARGTVPGNGLGVVVLKRLKDAIASGDCIHAIIKGSAINNDGSVKVGYTAPGVAGQASVIADAQANAGVEPETISYIEAHGTGTALGDPIEIAALTQAFQKSTQKRGFCAIGSVKTNIGHLDAAAGIAGLLKTVLALKHKLIPPSLHFQQPNPQIDFVNSPFYVNTELCEWETDKIPRRAGVSSFGIGGTNAHIILEEAEEIKFERDYQDRRETLPTYSFQRQRYWVDAPTQHETQQHSQTSIVNFLNQGNIEQLTHLLEKNNKLSPEQRQLLPDLLSILVKQHQQEINAEINKDWFYNLEWQAKPRQLPIQTTKPGFWLILTDRHGVGESLAKLLENLGYQCLLVYAGDTFKIEENTTWTIDPSHPEHFEILLQNTLSRFNLPLQKVVHLWSLEAASTENLTISTLEEAQIFNCASVLHLVQALVKHNQLVSPQLWLVTQGVVASVSVAQSSVWGLGKVIALEHPQLWGGMIDLAPDTLLDDAAKLLEEIENSEEEDHLAFQGGQRYVARLKQTQITKSQVQLREDSSYLITGGLGGLGLKIAKWMIEQGAKYLILISRHLVINKQEILREFEQKGVKILVAQADVSLQEDMVKLFEEIKVKMPPLRGIIHAAGVLNDGILQSQNWECFTQTLAPKVQGTWNLHTFTQKLPLDFFILFSSAASLLGSPGQGNYAAANAFMDAFAQYRQRLGLVGLSINWGQWSEIGMSANLSSHQQARLTAQGFSSIASEQGLQVLESLLASNLAQIAVLPVNWSLFEQKLPLLEIVQQRRKRHKFLESLEKIPTSDRLDVLINHIQQQVSQVLGLKSSQLKLNQGFADMGLDSLMAIELRNRLENSLDISLATTLVFEYPTIASLTQYIATNLLKWQPIITENLPKTEENLAVMISEIEQLTEAETEAAIAKEMAELESLLKENNN